MQPLKLSPGRIAWIALLCLLAFLAPRVRIHPPAGNSPGADNEDSQGVQRTQSSKPSSKRGTSALKPDDDLFDAATLPRLSVELSRAELAKLRKYRWQFGGNATERENATAIVYEGDQVYTNVTIHLKGSAGSFRSVDDKPSLTLNFAKLAPGQRFHGLKKIHLNNSVQDPSYLSEQISRELFLAAGVPTTRAAQAKLELNGRDLGVYVLIEGWNKQFLKRHFNQSDGVLYDGGFAKEIPGNLEVMSGDESTDRADLKELAAAARGLVSPPPKVDSPRRLEVKRPALDRFEKILDVDRFISFMAMESLLAHADGYAMNHNNYRIYHDPESGKMVFMPHGMDQMFGKWSSSPDHSITPPMKGLVARAVMQTPELRGRYMERIGELFTNVYKTDLILKRVEELAARLRPVVAEAGLWARPGHAQAVAELRRRISGRGASIQDQLAKRAAPAEFSYTGEVKVTGWTGQTGRGNANYAEMRDEDAHRLLKIKLRGTGYGSWRTQVSVPPGTYEFVGRAKVQGLAVDPADPRSGVGLRLSGYEIEFHSDAGDHLTVSDRRSSTRRTGPQLRLLSDSDWTDLAYDFEVQGPADLQLICELKGLQGEATFDADSLKVRRK